MGNGVVHFEINAPDTSVLEKFYGELFGWHVQSMPETGYAVIDTHSGGGINGGIGTSTDGSAYLTFYVEGPDIQALLDKAESLGGKTLVPVTPMNIVTFAHFTDPQGNRVGLVQSGDQEAPGVSSGDGVEVSWFEVLGPQPAALRDFYTELFGWTFKASDASGEFEYYQTETGAGGGIQGGIGATPDGQGHVNVYARVDDLQKRLERAETLGGKTAVPPMKVDVHTSIAQLTDPQGITFGLYVTEE
jgi:predicted enzyme related to lactoylglutathione lyase